MSDDPSKGASTSQEVHDFVADLDVGARDPANWQGSFIAGVALLWAVLQVFNASPLPANLAAWTGVNFFYVTSGQERIIHLAFGLVMASVAFPLFKGSPRDRIPWYDWMLATLGVVASLYLIANQSAIADWLAIR